MHILAVDIGGTNYSVALVNERGRVLEKIQQPTRRVGGRRWMLPRIVAAAQELAASSSARPALCGIGFGGPVDFARQRIRLSMHVGGWSGFPLAAWLEQKLGIPCVMDNDANVAALGEYACGAGRGARALVYVTISTGIGGGLLFNGEIYRGARDLAGEFGHMPLEPEGPLCSCGLHGCVEAFCSGTSLARDALRSAARRPGAWRGVALGSLDAKAVFAAARKGNIAANQLVERYCDYLARGLAGLIALLNPDRIVIGGGVSLAGDVLFVPLRLSLIRQIPPFLLGGWRCLPARLGPDSVLCGAAQLALRYTKRSR